MTGELAGLTVFEANQLGRIGFAECVPPPLRIELLWRKMVVYYATENGKACLATLLNDKTIAIVSTNERGKFKALSAVRSKKFHLLEASISDLNAKQKRESELAKVEAERCLAVQVISVTSEWRDGIVGALQAIAFDLGLAWPFSYYTGASGQRRRA